MKGHALFRFEGFKQDKRLYFKRSKQVRLTRTVNVSKVFEENGKTDRRFQLQFLFFKLKLFAKSRLN